MRVGVLVFAMMAVAVATAAAAGASTAATAAAPQGAPIVLATLSTRLAPAASDAARGEVSAARGRRGTIREATSPSLTAAARAALSAGLATAAAVGVARRAYRGPRGLPSHAARALPPRASLASGSPRFFADGPRTACRAADAELVEAFVSECSVAQDWQQAVEELGEAAGSGFDAGFAFISESHLMVNGVADVLQALRERLGIRTLIGCVCSGTIGRPCGPSSSLSGDADQGVAGRLPIEVEGGFSISVGLLRQASVTPFFIGAEGQGDTVLLDRKSADGRVLSILTFSDPFAPIQELLEKLDLQFPQAVKAGGISAVLRVGGEDRLSFTPSIAIAAEGCEVRLCNQGLVGLLLEDFEMHTVVCQGCCGVGPSVTVSDMNGPVCTGIGGRPAREALQLIFNAVDEATREKMKRALTLGVGPRGASPDSVGDGDWLIRSISNVTPEGGLVVGTEVSAGQPMRFHVRDQQSAEKDLELMLKRYRLESSFVDVKGPKVGCLLFTCNGRGAALYGRQHVDARAGAEALGSGMDGSGPLMRGNVAGFFCNGELGAPGLLLPDRDGQVKALRSAAVHGFTAVYALLIPVAGGSKKSDSWKPPLAA